jgi:ribonuclease D
MKNWEMEHLTSAMMDYAAADAFVSLDLLTAIIGDEDQHRQQQHSRSHSSHQSAQNISSQNPQTSKHWTRSSPAE